MHIYLFWRRETNLEHETYTVGTSVTTDTKI